MDVSHREIELTLSPQAGGPARNSARILARVSVVTSACAYLIFATIFVILWGPVYLTGEQGSLFLFPMALLALGPMFVLGLTAIVTGTVALYTPSATNQSSRLSKVGLTTGTVLVVLAVPVLWFGNAPLFFFGR